MSTENITTLDDIFQTGLEYIYDAEKQLTVALPKMAKAASSPELKQAFEEHQHETEHHVKRLEQIFDKLDFRPGNKPNVVLQAMTHEAEMMIQHTEANPLRDAALIVAGNQVEHWEIGSYGSLRELARVLGHDELIPILEETLDEEKQADQKLTQIAEKSVNPEAAKLSVQFTR